MKFAAVRNLMMGAVFSSSVLAACTTLPAGTPAAQADYAAEAQRAMDVFDATGFVAAVTIDGDVVFEQTFGKADEVSDAPFTPDMAVPIASISKAFTTTALAILVDRGLVEWDAPVRDYIPEFAMYDPWVSEHFTVRDALTHRSGLPLGAGDLLFWPDSHSTVDDILVALPHLKPTTGFRNAFDYDNLLYIVAGEIVARASGKSWADFVRDEILVPVGMNDCATDRTRLRSDQTLLTGHERAPGSDEGVPMDERTLFKPEHAAAGGLVCPVGEMMTWAHFWLDGAVTKDGKRLISEDQLQAVWTGVTPLRAGLSTSKSKATQFQLYGLGWFVSDFEGRVMISHSGGAPGVSSYFALLPEENIGIFAASNDYRPTAGVFTRQIADALLGGQDYDYIAEAGETFPRALEEAKAELASVAAPPEDAPAASLPLSAYTGLYRDAWYGTVRIDMRGGQLFIDMSRSELLDGPLAHFEADRFAAFWPDRSLKADAYVNFKVEDGRVTGFDMKPISEITDFSYDFQHLDFKRVATP